MLAEISVMFCLVICGFMLWLFFSALGDLRERVSFLEQSYSELYRSLTVIARIVDGGNDGLDNSCGSGGLERGDVQGDSKVKGTSGQIGAEKLAAEDLETFDQLRSAGAMTDEEYSRLVADI